MSDEYALPFSEKKKSAFLGYLITDPVLFVQARDKIKESMFDHPHHRKIWRWLCDWWSEFKQLPTIQELKEHPKLKTLDAKEASSVVSQIGVCVNARIDYTLPPLRDEVTKWIKVKAYTDGVLKSRATLEQGLKSVDGAKLNEAYDILAKSLRAIQEAEFETDAGVDLDPEVWAQQAKTSTENALTFGNPTMNKLLLDAGTGAGALLPQEMTVILAPADVGKCLGVDTPVMMFDGTVKPIQDVVAGDLLMGPDESPRTVLSTTTGTGPLYRITPSSGGDPWVCNDAHVLSLKNSWSGKSKKTYKSADGTTEWKRRYDKNDKGEVVNIPVSEYMTKSKEWRNRRKLWRTKLAFQAQDLPIDPYILGLWIGDGSSNTAALTTADAQLQAEWCRWVTLNGDVVSKYSKEGNKASTYSATIGPGNDRRISNQKLRDLKVLKNKHIPHIYKTSSVEQRLQLLAGLIDSDGYNGLGRSYEITSKFSHLAQDYAFLARGLGFRATVKSVQKQDQNGTEGTYFRVNISGDLTLIPVRLARKKVKHVPRRDPLLSKFEVEAIGEGKYYGITLDKDHLFLLGDYTVTHNTSTLITVIVENLLSQKDVLFLFHEGAQANILSRIFCAFTNQTVADFHRWRMERPEEVKVVTAMIQDHLRVVPIMRTGLTIEDLDPIIRREQDQWMASHGKGFDLLVDDYPAKLGTKVASRGGWEYRHVVRSAYNYFDDLAIEMKWHSLVAQQVTREGSKMNAGYKSSSGSGRLLDKEDASEAWGPIEGADNIITLNCSPQDRQLKLITMYVAKCKNARTGRAFVSATDWDRWRTHGPGLNATFYEGNQKMSPAMLAKWVLDYNGVVVPGTSVPL